MVSLGGTQFNTVNNNNPGKSSDPKIKSSDVTAVQRGADAEPNSDIKTVDIKKTPTMTEVADNSLLGGLAETSGLIGTNKINDYNELGKVITVGLLMVEPFVIRDVVIDTNGEEHVIFSGLVYDIWSRIKKINNWTHRVKEIELDADYDKHVAAVSNGEIDILIGNIWIFESRMKLVDYSHSIFLSKLVATYKPAKSNLRMYIELSVANYLLPMVIIVIIGVILGSILHKFEPERGFARSVFTTTATFMGEAGFLFENSQLRVKGMIYVFIIMSFAYYFSLMLQAIITSEVIDLSKKNDINKTNIRGKHFAVAKIDNAIAEVFTKYGITYDNIDIPIKDMSDYYIDNILKYDGYLVEYEQTKLDVVKNTDLKVTSTFGYEENAFCIRKGLWEFENHINIAITTLQTDDSINKICQKYLGADDAELCIL